MAFVNENDISDNPSKRISKIELQNFLIKQLNSGVPVAFLSLNAGRLPNLDNWHWVLIVGIEYDDKSLVSIIYDESRRKRIDLDYWCINTTKAGSFVGLKFTR